MGGLLFKNKPIDDVDKNSDDEDETKKASSLFSCFQRKRRKSENDDDDEDENTSSEENKKTGGIFGSFGTAYVDPPMPEMGRPVKYEKLFKRSMFARVHMSQIANVIIADAKASIDHAKEIPLGDNMYRVTITPGVTERMAQIRSNKQNRHRKVQNINLIERALRYRKMAIEMLNTNYSKKLVRDDELVDVNASRGLVERREQDQDWIPVSEFNTRREIKEDDSVESGSISAPT